METPNRVLFVDDEQSLRLTFNDILKAHGFEVRCAATVSEALSEMTTHTFDVLISDLNIGQPGDGFTVVSAMRRTQPECVNLILTGFPAFEGALSAIQRQVDDYLVKPTNIKDLVRTIQEKLKNRQPHHVPPLIRLSRLLREREEGIRNNALAKMKESPALTRVPMSDAVRCDYLHTTLTEIANQLDSSEPDSPTALALESGRALGLQRLEAGYEIAMLVTESGIVEDAVYEIVRERLLLLDTSHLVLDLKRFNRGLKEQLQRAVQAYWEETAVRRMDRRAG